MTRTRAPCPGAACPMRAAEARKLARNGARSELQTCWCSLPPSPVRLGSPQPSIASPAPPNLTGSSLSSSPPPSQSSPVPSTSQPPRFLSYCPRKPLTSSCFPAAGQASQLPTNPGLGDDSRPIPSQLRESQPSPGALSTISIPGFPVDSPNDEPKPISSVATTPTHFGFISLQTSSRD